MNKGFTLIELLAVIVILAIIALIATPIVLSIINDTKESAVIRSGEFYVDAVQSKIMQENMKLGGTLNPSECIVNGEGNVDCDRTPLEIEVDGQKPTSGSITFDKGKVTGVNLIFGDKTVTMNQSGELVLGDNIQICKLISGNVNEIGSKYECEVKPRTKFNFYVLSHESNGTTNLIMERNICEDGTVATAENKCTVAWYADDYDNSYGPITAMAYLNNATSSWFNIQNLNITYDDEGGNFTDFEVTGKARLPYYSEVSDYNESNGYLYNYLEDSGCQENSISGISAYWTFSSTTFSSEYAWYVSSDGSVHGDDVDGGPASGIRVVINVKL